MKRRNVDCGKIRRPIKRNKVGEGLYGSTFVYLKFLLVWLLVLAADFLLEFRFEYLWPFWLLLRSVYDSFRYQGLAFSVLFVCMALTSDMICLLFIPINWLFFAASTYVWVQFVWHTERGVCMPTVVLWALFIYIEALVRLKDIKNVPFHLDLCRPFAAHCIGYPVVTLGFGLKSYVGYRLRQRKQREVAKENEFYIQLLQEALPPELQVSSSSPGAKDKSDEKGVNGEVEVAAVAAAPAVNHTGGGCNVSSSSSNTSSSSSSSSSSNSSSSSSSGGGRVGKGVKTEPKVVEQEEPSRPPPPSIHRADKNRMPNGSTIHAEFEYMQKKGWSQSRSVNDFNESEAERDKSTKSGGGPGSGGGGGSGSGAGGSSHHHHNQSSSTSPHSITTPATTIEAEKKRVNAPVQSNGSARLPGSHTNNLRGDGGGGSAGPRDKKNKNKESNKDAPPPKDDTVNIIRLESDIKRLKADLQASRQTEQELRNQINTLVSGEKLTRQELNQLQQDNDNLQNKLHGLVTARQNDRSTISGLERRLAEERRAKQAAEAQVATLERRQKKAEEQAQARAHALATAKNECSESCRSRRGELEAEVKRARREQRAAEERVRGMERENAALRQYKDTQSDTEVLMSALSAMQDKNSHLESSLSAETRVKLDLFSALGEAKRQLEISQGLVSSKEKEIEELKAKITEVLAVCPPTSFPTSPPGLDASTPIQYTSKLLPPVSTTGLAGGVVLVDGLMEAQSPTSLTPSLAPSLAPSPLSPSLAPSPLSPSLAPSPLVDPLRNLAFPQQPHSPPAQTVPRPKIGTSPPPLLTAPPPLSAPPPTPAPTPKNPQHSNLDPNARVYTPKGTVTSEA